MGLLADRKERQRQKYSNQFISLYDSVFYLGEPKDESLQFIIEIMPFQSFLKLTQNGLINLPLKTTDDGNDWYLLGIDLQPFEIINHLKACIAQDTITQDNPIYYLGFGKKRFLSYLKSKDIEPLEQDIKNAQSPDLFFDDVNYLGDMDYYTIQSIINERDELRQNSTIKNTDLATKSKNTVAKIILALFELDGLDWQNADPHDYTNPHSLNNLIYTQLQKLGLEVSQKTIGNWISLAKEQV